MRKKANAADIEYIQKHNDKTPKELSEELDLNIFIVQDYWVEPAEKTEEELRAERAPKLGRSKIKLNVGGSVYQLTDDIIPPRSTTKPLTTKELDNKNGIFRG